MLLDPESEEMGCDLPFIPTYTPRLVLIDIWERGTWGWVKIISLYISTSPGFYRNIRDSKRMYLKLQSCHLTLMAHDETAGNELLASVLMWINLFRNFLDSGLQKVKCKASVNKSKSFPTLVTHIKVLLKRPWIPNCITNKGKYL